MISADIEVVDVNAQAWGNLARLLHLAPPPIDERPLRARREPALFFVQGGRLVHASRPGGGVLDIDVEHLSWQGPGSLPHLRRRVGAAIAVAIEDDALTDALTRAEGAVRWQDDLVAQGLAGLRALRCSIGKGLYLDPDPLAGIPLPTFASLQQAFDALFPDDRSLALFVFSRGLLHTSAILLKEGGDVILFTTHDMLPPLPPDLALAAAHHRLIDAVRRRVGPPSLAASLDLTTWRRIESGPPGSAALALADGSLIVDPAPSWLLALIGASAAVGAAATGARLLSRFVPATVREVASGVGGRLLNGVNPFAALGFDPLELMARLRPFLHR